MIQAHFRLKSVRANSLYTLRLSFADGAVMTVDLAKTIRRHPSLVALKNEALFSKPKLIFSGAVVSWNNEDALELAADNLRALAVTQSGGTSHEVVWDWMSRHNLSLDAAAQALGLSRRLLAYYRSGAKPVPRTVALAMTGWEAEQRHAA